MTGLSAFLFHDDYLKYQFGPSHPFKPIREKLTLDLLREIGIFDNKIRVYEPEPATENDLLLVHSKEYIQYVKKTCEKGFGYLDYGDTPAKKGLYEGACRVVGGSILGCKLILDGEVNHVFNPGGGLHHAKADSASGFCVFNDIAIAIRYLQRIYEVKRIAIVDIDGHHGDGTQDLMYYEPFLKISLHRFGIFPGTGRITEIGAGNGKGYSINIPLQGGTGDEAYLYAFKEVVQPLIESYKPEILINQFGVDGHYQDPLVGLALTTKTYLNVANTMHTLAHRLCDGKLLVVGGGGYNIENTVRCWAIAFLTICGCKYKNNLKFKKLFDERPPQQDKRVLETTQKTVEDIKKLIFPIHKIGL